MENSKTGVLLVNVGTPDSPAPVDVWKYLRQFLMDGRIIDIPYWRRLLLVNLIIAPFRAPKSAREYQKIWSEKGSPLMYHSCNFRDSVQEQLGDNFIVSLAMRYQNPSIESALETLRQQRPSSIVIFPLFPQYASATVGSVHEKVMQVVQKWPEIPKLRFIDSFYDHPRMIQTIACLGKRHFDEAGYDHTFSLFMACLSAKSERVIPTALSTRTAVPPSTLETTPAIALSVTQRPDLWLKPWPWRMGITQSAFSRGWVKIPGSNRILMMSWERWPQRASRRFWPFLLLLSPTALKLRSRWARNIMKCSWNWEERTCSLWRV